MAAPRLKVFRSQMGFAETVVAAPSQAAALKAWGARQNLFAEGLASVTDDAEAVKAATARPGVVLQRPVGSSGAYAEDLIGAPDVPVAPTEPKPKTTHAAHIAPRAKPRPRPDRSPLDTAQAELAKVEAQAKASRDDLAERRRALDAEAARLERETVQRRRDATRARDAAQTAYDAALAASEG